MFEIAFMAIIQTQFLLIVKKKIVSSFNRITYFAIKELNNDIVT